MTMNRGTVMPSFGDIWRDLQKDWNGNDVPRTINDEVELSFWKPFLRDKESEGPDAYSRRIWDAISDILGEEYYDTITEIGPGWGNYTFDLVEHCRHLICVDMSPDVLDHIGRTAHQYHLNIDTVCSKWEDYRGKVSDVVFGFNCFYRMSEIESCLSKIDQMGRRRIIGMTSGPEKEYLAVFEKELGLRIRYTRLDYVVLVNILYQLGIDVNVRIVDLQKDYAYRSVPAAARIASKRILSEEYDMEDIIRIMRRYLKKGDDGLYHYVHDFKAAIIYW